jgi:uncharacterized protein
MELFALRCPWYIAGPLVGLLITGLLWATNKPLGALGGYCDTVQWLQARARDPSWRVLLLLGIVIGGFLSAVAAGGWLPTLAYGSFDAVLGNTLVAKALTLFAAGGLIGFGARLAGGCTSGHGMCGTSMGSPASLVATVTFMATAIMTANGLAWLLGVRS